MSAPAACRKDQFFDPAFESPSSATDTDELFAQPGLTGGQKLREFLSEAARGHSESVETQNQDTVPRRFCSRLRHHST